MYSVLIGRLEYKRYLGRNCCFGIDIHNNLAFTHSPSTMRGPAPQPEFFATESIDSGNDKIAGLPPADASEGWLLSSSSTTVISKTYLGKQRTMAISPIRRPLLPKKSERLALKACRSTSKDLQEKLSLSPSEMNNPGLIDDPFCSSASDSDSSNEEFNEYTSSSTELWDLYFSEEEKSSYQRSPLYQVDAPKSSQLCLQADTISPANNNLISPLRRSDAQRTPRRATQGTYSAFPSLSTPRTSTTSHPKYASWPARKESRLKPKGQTRTRPRAETAPSIPSSANSSHLTLSPPHSAPASPSSIQPFMPLLEKSVWEHDDDEKSSWRKALHIRASSSGGTASEEKKSWTRKTARNVVKGLFGGGVKKVSTSTTSPD